MLVHILLLLQVLPDPPLLLTHPTLSFLKKQKPNTKTKAPKPRKQTKTTLRKTKQNPH